MPQTIFERVVAAVGSQSELARALNIRPQSVIKWKKRIPWERAPQIASLTGIPLHEIRPDKFGRPDEAP